MLSFIALINLPLPAEKGVIYIKKNLFSEIILFASSAFIKTKLYHGLAVRCSFLFIG